MAPISKFWVQFWAQNRKTDHICRSTSPSYRSQHRAPRVYCQMSTWCALFSVYWLRLVEVTQTHLQEELRAMMLGMEAFLGEKKLWKLRLPLFLLGLFSTKRIFLILLSFVLLIFWDVPRSRPYPTLYKVKEEPEWFLRKSDIRMGSNSGKHCSVGGHDYCSIEWGLCTPELLLWMPIAPSSGHLCIKGQTVLQGKERGGWDLEVQPCCVYIYPQDLWAMISGSTVSRKDTIPKNVSHHLQSYLHLSMCSMKTLGTW